jgi:hypothetical protein
MRISVNFSLYEATEIQATKPKPTISELWKLAKLQKELKTSIPKILLNLS